MLIEIQIVPMHQRFTLFLTNAGRYLIQRLEWQFPARTMGQQYVPLMQEQRFIEHSQLSRRLVKGIYIS